MVGSSGIDDDDDDDVSVKSSEKRVVSNIEPRIIHEAVRFEPSNEIIKPFDELTPTSSKNQAVLILWHEKNMYAD